MHKFASFNHEILHNSDIKISAVSSASLYGKGIFTTIAVNNSKPFLWEKHWRRLNLHADKLGLKFSVFNEEQVLNSLNKIIEKNNIKNGRCRLTFFDESSSKIWQTKSENRTSLLIQTADLRKVKQNFSIYVSTLPVNSLSPLAGIKSCNYMENILALEEASKYGLDEMIRYNERSEVVSFCMANIFWLEFDDEKLYTPSLETGCLAGTTRELIIEKFVVLEVKKEINTLFRDAESIFITSSGIGISQIADINGDKLNQRDHEITDLIQNEINKNYI
jgi:branched-subunit amino acid aminotransferase/4-amino-4-deoxychorismate lyase